MQNFEGPGCEGGKGDRGGWAILLPVPVGRRGAFRVGQGAWGSDTDRCDKCWASSRDRGPQTPPCCAVLKLKEVPVLVAEKMKPKDVFLLNLVSNWKQGCSDMDRARALGLASQEFHFKEHEILSVVMPLLGLVSDKAVLEFYRRSDRFPASFKDLIEDGKMPFRGCFPF